MSRHKKAVTLKMRATTGATVPRSASNDIVVYRWGRIFGALAVLFLLIIGIAWLLWPVSEVDRMETDPTAEPQTTSAGAPEPEQAEVNPPQPDYLAATNERADAGEDADDGQATVSGGEKPDDDRLESAGNGTTESSDIQPDDGGAEAVPSPASNSDAQAVADDSQTPAGGEESPAASGESTAMGSGAGAGPADSADSDAAQTDTDAGPAAAEVSIQSSHLQRAALTRELQDREPTGDLPSEVTMNADGIIRVYFFNHLSDLKGQALSHNWYRNGERAAQVRMRPRTDSVRASSSKYINRNMLGEWRVEAVTEDGVTLGSGQFNVVGGQSAEQ